MADQDWFSANAPKPTAAVAPTDAADWFAANAPKPQTAPMNFAVVNGQRVPVDENSLGTFTRHYASQVNPLPIGQLLPFPKALGGAGMDAPLQAAKNILQAQSAVLDKAEAARKQGNYLEAARHFIDWLAPVIGPVLDKAADEFQQGKLAAGAGDTLGFSTAIFGPSAANAFKQSAVASKLAATAEKGAEARSVETLAPQVGPNKVRLGNQMAEAGPQVLRETSAVTRPGILDQAASRLDDAYSALDAAYDRVPATRMYPTAPIKAALQREIQNLSVSGIGGAVEPATRASRIASLRQALTEVQGLGSVANLDNLRKLRIAWDEGAKAVFTPSVAQDFLKARGAGSGWADARTALNDYIVGQHPELTPLNQDAHLWKQAVDVMQAAEESDRVRPKVGRTIMARGLGAAVGGSAEGTMGAAVGAVIGPSIERMAANLHPAAKIVVGRQMARLSDALRAGQTVRAQSLLNSLKALLQPVAIKAAQTASSSPGYAPAVLAPVGQP